jgi:hypothetical protein
VFSEITYSSGDEARIAFLDNKVFPASIVQGVGCRGFVVPSENEGR